MPTALKPLGKRGLGSLGILAHFRHSPVKLPCIPSCSRADTRPTPADRGNPRVRGSHTTSGLLITSLAYLLHICSFRKSVTFLCLRQNFGQPATIGADVQAHRMHTPPLVCILWALCAAGNILFRIIYQRRNANISLRTSLSFRRHKSYYKIHQNPLDPITNIYPSKRIKQTDGFTST
jgi:hypothetical protein